MSQNTAATGLQGRYATALFDLANSAKQLDVVKGDLELLDQAIANSDDLRNVLRSPVISRDVQAKAMAALLDKLGVSELTKKTVGLLSQKRRLFALPGVIDSYLSMLSAHNGEVTAQVTSASELKKSKSKPLPALSKKLSAPLSKWTLKLIRRFLAVLSSRSVPGFLMPRFVPNCRSSRLAMKGVA